MHRLLAFAALVNNKRMAAVLCLNRSSDELITRSLNKITEFELLQP
jgi:hypothetical protein